MPIFSKATIFLPFRQQIFAAFTEEFLAAPFTDQIFHFIIPALADVQTIFPYELFLNALLLAESGCSRGSDQAPWLFYFVLTVGETYLGEQAEGIINCFFSCWNWYVMYFLNMVYCQVKRTVDKWWRHLFCYLFLPFSL